MLEKVVLENVDHIITWNTIISRKSNEDNVINILYKEDRATFTQVQVFNLIR